MKIYTKTGDDGDTGLLGGVRVRKDDLRIEAYGAVDELNSALGMALSMEEAIDTLSYPFWKSVQINLFRIGTELATPPTVNAMIDFVQEEDVVGIEHEIDRLEQQLEPLKHFILPGGSELGSRLHFVRTVCRRAERAVIRLDSHTKVRPECIRYLNRLSDVLFVTARSANDLLGYDDRPWIPERKK